MKNPELQKALKDGKLLSETIKDDKALADIKFPVFVADIDEPANTSCRHTGLDFEGQYGVIFL